jgi:hypothetical protein
MRDEREGFSIWDRARIRFWAVSNNASTLPPSQGQGGDALRVPCGTPPLTKKDTHE